MEAKDLSKSELIAVLEVIEDAVGCDSEAALHGTILRVKELVCADYAVCGLARAPAGDPIEVLTVINGSYPEEWLRVYMDERLYTKDPVVRHHARFTTTQLWTDTFRFYRDETSSTFLHRAYDFGLKNGLTSGVFDPVAQKTSLFSFAGDGEEAFGVHHKKVVDLVVPHLHRAIIKVFEGATGVSSMLM